MTNQELMTNVLDGIKGLNKLLADATTESSNDNVHQVMKEALDTSLMMQNSTYNLMASKGWYKIENTTMDKIDKVKQKFSN